MQSHSQEDDIINFMSITGCQDYQKAQSYIQMAENNLENAIQLYMEFQEGHTQNTQQNELQNQQQQRPVIQETPKRQVQNSNQGYQRLPTDAALVEKYRKYQEEKRANADGIVKKTYQLGVSIFSYFLKNQPNYGSDFLKYIQQQKIQTEIAFQNGNFQEKLKQANKETRPLLIYLHDHSSILVLQKMSNCKSLVTNINRNYHIVGFLANQQVYEQLPHKPDPPKILIYKLDIVDEIVLMEEIPLTIDSNFEEVAQKIKTLRATFNKEYIHIENLKKEVNSHNQYYGNYAQPNMYQGQQQQYQQIQVQRQKNEQRERDLLIQSQKEAYHFAEQLAMEKKRQDEELKQQEQAKQLELQQKEEQRLLKKAQFLQNLQEEPENNSGISILFRFINSTRTRRFDFNDKIQILFDFVQSQDDDCFHDPYAQIDLIQNFPRLSLKDKTELMVKEVFIDSQMEQLIVVEQE